MLLLLLALACTKTDTDTGDTDTDVADADGDGFLTPDDCDDHDADVHPGATETCDAVDQDCDGSVDEDAVDVRTFYADADHDTYGDPGAPVVACDKVTGEVDDATDCDDADGDVHPGAGELCNGVDDDCDGTVDEDPVDAPTLYVDGDGDGFGGAAVTACPGAGLSAEGDDCDDADAAIHPGATEICDDGVDQDCDPASCRLSGDYDDPIAKGTADVSWKWPGSSYAMPYKWGAWGDVDGDGYDDALVTYGQGASQVVVGVEWGGTVVSSTTLPGATTLESPDTTGFSVLDAGDVDGDGFADVLLATGSDLWIGWGDATRPGTVALDSAGTGFPGGTLDVGFVGDADGDGAGDWLTYDDDVQTVWLVYGSSTRPSGGSLADVASGGMTTAGARHQVGGLDGGDFDGDGLAELLVGTADTSGIAVSVSVFYGDATRRTGTFASADADARFSLDAWVGMFSDEDPTDLGDIDGDGYDDLGIGAGGHAWVWPGASARWSGDYDDTTAATHYSSANNEVDARITGGDLDADGFSDVAIGLAWSGDPDSSVRVFYGSSSPWGTFDVHSDADASIHGKINYGLALALDLGGDLDGDGHADLLGVEDGQLDGAWVFLGAGD